MSLYTEITKLPRDPIIGLTELFKNDKRSTKYNLGVGVYLDENGNVPVLECVTKAAQLLYEKKDPYVYLPMVGFDSFCEATKKLLFGPAHSSNANIITTQALGGTGALRLGAELLRRTKTVPLVVISEPSWENHRNIFESAGFKVNTYPYYDSITNCFLFQKKRKYRCLRLLYFESVRGFTYLFLLVLTVASFYCLVYLRLLTFAYL